MTTPPPLPPPSFPPLPPDGGSFPPSLPSRGRNAPMQSLPSRRDAEEPAKFSIHWAALLAGAPLAVVLFLAGGRFEAAQGAAGARIAIQFGYALFGVVIAGGVAFALWRLFGRPRRAGSVLFLVLLGAMGVWEMRDAGMLPAGLGLGGPSTAVADAPADAPAGAPPSGLADPTMPDNIAKIVEEARASTAPRQKAKPAGPRRSPDDSVRAAADSVRQARAKTDLAIEHWEKSGAYDLGTVKTSKQLARRVELLDALHRAFRGWREAGLAARERLRADLAAAGVPAAAQQKYLSDLATSANLDADREAAVAAEKMLLAGRQEFRFLQQGWGRWHVDPLTSQVLFQNPAETQRFSRLTAIRHAAQADLNDLLQRQHASKSRQ